ncbi:amino acid permease-domain-containing protein [Lasiosphaeris hirsuta]|uniref:Amino acid permease-domain-containing protein n=1 Tax=Lasiosphaeris hirsuta TaxID=260670 RepID=A0AA40E0Q9_9PEZI|nr:amino acid permease-domain-containing protein [Lasiosphaeris hirsuta]
MTAPTSPPPIPTRSSSNRRPIRIQYLTPIKSEDPTTPERTETPSPNHADTLADTSPISTPWTTPTTSTDNQALKREITTRQMLLIALGGSIGTGLFVGSGQALSVGGPGNLVVNFALGAAIVGMAMASLGEMAANFPVAGGFYEYGVRFVGKPWGFAIGWNFVLSWLLALPFELITIVAVIRYWRPDIQPALVIAPFLIVLAMVSYRGARWFGELEHWLGLAKVVCISTFICFAFACVIGAVESDPRGALGDRYWRNPEPFLNGFGGFLFTFRIAGMSYGGTELLGLVAAECKFPHRVMPLATKVVFFRLVVFYVVTLVMLGFVVSSSDPNLAQIGHGAKYSPLVLAANEARVPGLAHFFNGMIVTALVSMANTCGFSSSRALQALCARGMGPKLLGRVYNGVPFPALVVSFGFGTLAFTTCAPQGEEIFDLLVSFSAVSNYLTWASICLAHIRMRHAMSVQGRSTNDLIWVSPFGICGSFLGLFFCVMGLIAHMPSIWLVRGGNHSYTSLPGNSWLCVIFCLFSCSLLFYTIKEGLDFHPINWANDIDLSTGFRSRQQLLMADELYAEERNRKLGLFGWQEGITWQERARFCYVKPAGKILVMWLNMIVAWENAENKFRRNWQALREQKKGEAGNGVLNSGSEDVNHEEKSLGKMNNEARRYSRE